MVSIGGRFQSANYGGIPQGSCLWPLLFILFKKCFCLEISSPNWYTDDPSVTFPREDLDAFCNDFGCELAKRS